MFFCYLEFKIGGGSGGSDSGGDGGSGGGSNTSGSKKGNRGSKSVMKCTMTNVSGNDDKIHQKGECKTATAAAPPPPPATPVSTLPPPIELVRLFDKHEISIRHMLSVVLIDTTLIDRFVGELVKGRFISTINPETLAILNTITACSI